MKKFIFPLLISTLLPAISYSISSQDIFSPWSRSGTNLTVTNRHVQLLAVSTLTVSGQIVGLSSATVFELKLSGKDCSVFGNSGKLTTDASGNVVCANDISGSGSGGGWGGVTNHTATMTVTAGYGISASSVQITGTGTNHSFIVQSGSSTIGTATAADIPFYVRGPIGGGVWKKGVIAINDLAGNSALKWGFLSDNGGDAIISATGSGARRIHIAAGAQDNPTQGQLILDTKGNVYIGSSTTTLYALQVDSTTVLNKSTYTWPSVAATAGQILANNGSGILTWEDDGGGGADDLGNHIATMTVTMGYGFTATTATVTGDFDGSKSTGTWQSLIISSFTRHVEGADNLDITVPTLTANRAVTFGDAAGEISVLGQTIDLTAEITGTLPVGNGGTGATTLTDGGILLGSGSGAITALGAASNGQIPIGDGTTDPQLATITGGNDITITNGAASITVDADNTLTRDTEIDTFSELDTLVADQTLTHNGLIDTYSELNTIVADVTLTHNGLIDTFSELDTIVADENLLSRSSTITYCTPAMASVMTSTSTSVSLETFVTATNGVLVDYQNLQQGTSDYVSWNWLSPPEVDAGSVTFRVTFFSTGTTASETVAFALQIVATSDDDALDASFGTEVTVTDTITATDDYQATSRSGIIPGNTWAAEDLLSFKLRRDWDSDNATGNINISAVDVCADFTGMGDTP